MRAKCVLNKNTNPDLRTQLKFKNHKPRNTNTNPATDLPSQPNTKATNTNPATDFSCQPNTKTTNTNPNISKNTNTNPAIHLQKTCNPSSENPSPNTNSLLESKSESKPVATATKSLSAPWVTISAVDFHTEEPISSMAWLTNLSDS